jgi:hypothetical protein
MTNRLSIAILVLITSAFQTVAQPLALKRHYISVIVDASLSMGQPLGSVSKMAATHEVLSAFFTKLEKYPELQASLSTFGSAKSNTDPAQCTDFKFLVPFDVGNTARLNVALRRILPFGTSPVSYAMRTAVKALPADGAKRYVIIFTDGGDSCMELVCDQYAQQDSLTNGIFIIGLGIPAEDQELYSCSQTFANADSSTELAQALQRIFDSIKPY